MGRLRQVLGDRPFMRSVATLAVPMVIQGTVTNVVSLLDNVMVGNIGTLPMSAVAIVNQLMMVFYLCIWGGLSGPDIFGTQYAGKKDHDGVRHCFRIKWIVCLVVLFVFTIAFLCFPDGLIRLYLQGESTAEASSLTMEYAKDYLFVMVLGMLPFAVAMNYATTLRGIGETRVPMIASTAAIFVNLLFNYLLIFGKLGFPCLGVTGAAVATVISRLVELGIIMLHTHLHTERYPFIRGAYRSLRVPTKLFKDVCKCGWLLWGNELFWSAGLAGILQGFSLRGLEAVAACNIAMTVANVFTCVFYSVGNTLAIMVGHELGAGRTAEAEEVGWKLNSLGLLTAFAVGAVVSVLAPFIPQFYNTEDGVRRLATVLIWITASYWPFRAFVYNCFFMIRAGGKAGWTTAMDSGFMWFVRMPIVWSIGYLTDMDIRLFYFIVYWLAGLQCVLAYWMVCHSGWKRNLV